MTMHLNPYINFRGNAREAAEFYHSVFGGDLTITTFADLQASSDPSEGNLVMHSVLSAPDGLTLMMSDAPERREYTPGTNMTVSLNGDRSDEAKITGFWNALVEGATITMPLSTAVWGDAFGMCVDKFGIAWLINISAATS